MSKHSNQRHEKQNKEDHLDEWLSNLENERRTLIARLRHIDSVLMKYGRLKRETIPERVR